MLLLLILESSPLEPSTPPKVLAIGDLTEKPVRVAVTRTAKTKPTKQNPTMLFLSEVVDDLSTSDEQWQRSWAAGCCR